MPLYEYLCNNPKCETESFEVLTTYKDTVEMCPKCKEKSKDRKKFYQFDFRM
jgi:predicted nucleic acid-binding Zn ribbon protein